jgi:ADP-dependent NAD(P)H-hydrate dehydratase / NAD(P)H-hydrate epimerase
MNILNSAQIKIIDAYTINKEPVKSIDLMERAAGRCAEWIRRRMNPYNKIHVFCGMGNNGGDGLAIARMLSGRGKSVQVYKVSHAAKASPDFIINEKRLSGLRNLNYEKLAEGDPMPVIEHDDLVVDAILGNGITRKVEGHIADIVCHINASGSVIISVDMPTGLFDEDNGENDRNTIIRADYTLTFQYPKLSFLFPSNDEFVGSWHVLDIGLLDEGMHADDITYRLLDHDSLKQLYHPRKKFSHKGNYGHALLVAGSYGKMGAAVLTGSACLKSGAGLLTMFVPSSGYQIILSVLPEAMCITDDDQHHISSIPILDAYNVIGIGPGLGTEASSQRAFKRLIQEAVCPLLIDADAINILAENPTWCDFLPKNSVLTPHPKEFERLAGKTTNDYERLMNAVRFAGRFQVIIVLKGAYTAIVLPDGRCFFNPTGNPGMAKGGSGDVLTGVILGWMAKNYGSAHSAMMGVFLHGLAGDLAAKGRGVEGIMARDIIDMLPKAGMKLLGQ